MTNKPTWEEAFISKVRQEAKEEATREILKIIDEEGSSYGKSLDEMSGQEHRERYNGYTQFKLNLLRKLLSTLSNKVKE